MIIDKINNAVVINYDSIEVVCGDIIYISSDLSQLTYTAMKELGIRGKKELDGFFHKFVNSLQTLVGPEGTLLIPMFTWSFCRGIPYDTRSTPGEVGALGNWILKNRTDFARTRHPLYSFMVWGKDADKLVAMENRTAWGQDSPFAYLHHNHGKNLLINVSLEACFTFTHYVEESIGVPYRYFKDFHGTYIDEAGESTERTYTMFVRDLDIDSKQVTPDNCLIDAGVATCADSSAGKLQLVDLAAAYPIIVNNYKNHNGNHWYDFLGYKIDWTSGQTHADETTMNI